MFRALYTAILSVTSIALVLFGLCSAVMAYFLPMVFLDTPQPNWLTGTKLLLLGMLATASGAVLWIEAWKPWIAKEEIRTKTRSQVGSPSPHLISGKIAKKEL